MATSLAGTRRSARLGASMEEYRYEHFHPRALVEDARFLGGPGPGDQLSDFDLPATDGGRITTRGFLGRSPLLLTFASVT
jgi:hypothetical protein